MATNEEILAAFARNAEEIVRLELQVAQLREALEVARGVCGRNNCNCPGASKVRAAVSHAFAMAI